MLIRMTTLSILLVASLTACGNKHIPEPSSSAVESNPITNPADAQQSTIANIMQASGMNQVIQQIPAIAAQAFDQHPPLPNHRDQQQFRQAFIQAHDADKIHQIVVNHLNQQYDQQRYSDFLALLNMPLTQKISDLETKAQTPQAQQRMMQMGNMIMGQATPERLNLVRQLDDAMGATEMGITMQMMISKAIMTNMNTLLPPHQQLPAEQLAQMLAQQQMQSSYPIRQFTQLSMVYAYSSITDEELKIYLQQNQSELGQWANQLLQTAWVDVSSHIATNLAAHVNETFVNNNAL